MPKLGNMGILVIITISLALFVSLAGCKKEGGKKSETPKPSYALDPIVVNLADEDERYLRITIGLELSNEASKEVMKQNEHVVKDAILMLLSGKYYDDIRSQQGKAKLKSEILNTLNRSLKQKCVEQAYFTEFIAQ